MSEDDTDETSQSLVAGEPNERLVIEWAIGVLQGKGHIEEADDELIETLRRLYHANPICQTEVSSTATSCMTYARRGLANTSPPPMNTSAKNIGSDTKHNAGPVPVDAPSDCTSGARST